MLSQHSYKYQIRSLRVNIALYTPLNMASVNCKSIETKLLGSPPPPEYPRKIPLSWITKLRLNYRYQTLIQFEFSSNYVELCLNRNLRLLSMDQNIPKNNTPFNISDGDSAYGRL